MRKTEIKNEYWDLTQKVEGIINDILTGKMYRDIDELYANGFWDLATETVSEFVDSQDICFNDMVDVVYSQYYEIFELTKEKQNKEMTIKEFMKSNLFMKGNSLVIKDFFGKIILNIDIKKDKGYHKLLENVLLLNTKVELLEQNKTKTVIYIY